MVNSTVLMVLPLNIVMVIKNGSNGGLHRTDGPAYEYTNGTKHWYLNGKRHRTDGPAVEYADGDGEWYIDGVKLSEKEYLQVTRNNKLQKLGL